MPSRRYFTNGAATYTPATIRGAWDATGNDSRGLSPVVKALLSSKTGSFGVATMDETSATTNYDRLWGRWISEPVAGGSLSGTVQWIAGVIEGSTQMNAFFHVHIFATVGDSDTLRATLLTDNIGATEFPTAAHTGRGEGTTTVTTTTLNAGDRVVVEMGYRANNTSTAQNIAEMVYGATGATDLASGSTAVTTDPAWIEFSDPNNVLADFVAGAVSRPVERRAPVGALIQL